MRLEVKGFRLQANPMNCVSHRARRDTEFFEQQSYFVEYHECLGLILKVLKSDQTAVL